MTKKGRVKPNATNDSANIDMKKFGKFAKESAKWIAEHVRSPEYEACMRKLEEQDNPDE